jgi:hypothetical protein
MAVKRRRGEDRRKVAEGFRSAFADVRIAGWCSCCGACPILKSQERKRERGKYDAVSWHHVSTRFMRLPTCFVHCTPEWVPRSETDSSHHLQRPFKVLTHPSRCAHSAETPLLPQAKGRATTLPHRNVRAFILALVLLVVLFACYDCITT